MKKILITGGNGLVGTYLKKILNRENYSIFAFGKEHLNIIDSEKTYKIFKDLKPEIVIHLAALTDVDFCEKNPETTFLINSKGTENISKLSIDFKCFLIYLSTDFIFDGMKGSPYSEEDKPNPINIYGKSKLLGEKYIINNCEKYLIIRTSRIFGKGGKNFSSRLREIMKQKKEIVLTTDLINSPTYASSLAECILKLIEKEFCGIINVCNEGWCSFFEFGLKMKEILNLNLKIKGISFNEFLRIYKDIAPRPKFSPLSIDLLNSLNIKVDSWERGLEKFLKEY
ncbi:MAG: dTDP-4-dehydrorhamnose reductase [Candidatus Omnitrophica bacterium]|nr:dTDP-4-dehydrorhamnose reductase [Candidatus Omnitrophota bacterium]MCM8801755.1 dTDP-4-dehydrorhamnose reductase [Candidatus Omnitrophota bacterium]